MRRTQGLIAAVAVVAVLAAGVAWARHDDDVPSAAGAVPTGAPVNPEVPQARLLQDVLDIIALRQAGDANFSFVPKDQPPGLLRMNAGGTGDGTTDTYQFGDKKLQAVSVFTAKPAGACTGLCVRDSAVLPMPSVAGFQHVVVYFTGNVTEAASTSDPQTAAAQRFWAGVEFVPVDQAVWFTDLKARAGHAAIR